MEVYFEKETLEVWETSKVLSLTIAETIFIESRIYFSKVQATLFNLGLKGCSFAAEHCTYDQQRHFQTPPIHF
ncbi:hypothetical protein C7460_12226 [Marinoscillum furvescens DSM 4134]|uniref:Uncharacterized protein n=1 Tax=Marinoscillum furvescens DSM 4134 TaxID=1122208 RepID=A0A3D9KZ03_MARFU|nr:hypothetical protein C7460_12226 [Marinoscillum furvescens DSM 4134]